jgi:hypothetical protein
MAYGLKTFKADGTTAILQNSTKSGVFAQTYTIPEQTATGTLIPFPQYTGRTLRIFQLRPGIHSWYITYTNSVPTLNLIKNPDPSIIGGVSAGFYYSDTVLYIFVK